MTYRRSIAVRSISSHCFLGYVVAVEKLIAETMSLAFVEALAVSSSSCSKCLSLPPHSTRMDLQND